MIFEIITMGITGVVAGILSGMFGLGGGVVVVPILYVYLQHIGISEQLNMHMAVATSLAVMLITTFNSMWSHHRKGNIDWAIIRQLAPWMVCGVIIGTIIAHFLHSDWLRYCFMALLAYVILNALFKKGFTEKYTKADFNMQQNGLTKAYFTCTGFLAVLLGIGGSVFTVPFFRRAKAPMVNASALAVALTPIVALFGTIGYIITGLHADPGLPYDFGYIYIPAFLGIGVGTLLGVPVGSHLASTLDDRYLARTYIVLLIIFLIMIIY